jgi:hypothetical protein
MLSLKGRNENNIAVLTLTTTKEEEPVTYQIQKSKDGSHFETIDEIVGFKNPSLENNYYTYADPDELNSLTWYRINAIKTQGNKQKYSKVIQLINKSAGLQIQSLVNPFTSQIKFDLISGTGGTVQVDVLDQYAHILKSGKYNTIKGVNNFTITNTDNLPAGVYILRVNSGTTIINKKIIKRY